MSSPRVAYLVLAHHLPSQLERLVGALSSRESACFVHVDRRAQRSFGRTAERIQRAGATVISKQRCHWGHPSLVRASLALLESALDAGGFDYAVLLSGQDYPIKSPRAIARFLSDRDGSEFIKHYPVYGDNPWQTKSKPWNARARIEDWHLMLGPRRFSIPARRRLPLGLTPYIGYQWWALTRAAAEHVVRFVHTHPNYLEFFERVYVSDELFFQSILLNSRFGPRVVNDDLRFVDWGRANPTLPAVLEESDFDRLQRAPELLARKFDASRTPALLDRIDREILA